MSVQNYYTKFCRHILNTYYWCLLGNVVSMSSCLAKTCFFSFPYMLNFTAIFKIKCDLCYYACSYYDRILPTMTSKYVARKQFNLEV